MYIYVYECVNAYLYVICMLYLCHMCVYMCVCVHVYVYMYILCVCVYERKNVVKCEQLANLHVDYIRDLHTTFFVCLKLFQNKRLKS